MTLFGRTKAAFFAAFGFDASVAAQLAQQLILIAQTEPISEAVSSPHGVKYSLIGQLHGLNGRTARVKTIWIIEHGQQQPRLVSAYPAREEEQG